MIRTAFRILLALLLAALVWWIGPLIAIGVYRPFGWLALRQSLVVLILLWGFWPLLGRCWTWLAMGTRWLAPTPRSRTFDAIGGRLRDLDRQLLARWQRQPRRRFARWRGKLRREHRGFLPWLLVLGAVGSGKTSLVAHAAAQGRGRRAENAWREGARTADVEAWLTEDAVWFDTSGRWTLRDNLDEEGFSAWTRLLRGLRGMRAAPVLNGVVLCVDVRSLLDSSLEVRKRLAEAMRGRLGELSDTLSQPLQVYLALTGLDQIEGAITLLSGMSSLQWSHGLGLSLPDEGMSIDGMATEALWRDAVLELEHRVQQQVLYAAPAATDISANHQQLRFVEALARLRGPLLAFMAGVIAPGEGDSLARLRGVWFGSVAQLVDGETSTTPDVSPEPDSTRSLGQLWNPLCRQVVIEQGNAWGRRQRPWRIRLASGLRWGALGSLALVGLVWLFVGYSSERNHLERVWAEFNEGKRLAQSQARDGGSSSGTALLEVASQMRYARDQADATAQLMPTSFIEHRRIAQVANATYARHLERTLMPELHNAVQEDLRAQAEGAPGDLYLTLKTYLMLSRPDRRSGDDLERWINTRWEALAGGGAYGDEDRRRLVAHARALFSLPALPATPESAELVRSARARASQIPSVTRVLQHIRDQGLAPSVNDVSLASAAGFSASLTLRLRSNLATTDTVVQGWYTRSGYLDNFLPRLNASARAILEEESWVLRDERLSGNAFEIERTAQKLADATRSQFLQDYVQAWRNFLNDVTVRSFTGLDDASQLAAALIDPQSALASLLRFAGRETSLTGNYEGDIDSRFDRQKHNLERGRRAVVGEIAGEHYRAKLPPEHVVEDHFSAVRRLATQLTQTGNSSNPLARLFEPVSRQLGLVNGAMQAGQILPQYDAFARLRQEAGRQPEPLRGVLLDLINHGSALTAKQSSGMLTRGAAGGTTRAVCDQGVAGRYPLRRGANAEAGVQDYEQLFGPQGLMATQFKEQLLPYIDTGSLPWRARRPEGGAGALINDEIVRSYEVADRIRSATLDNAGRLKVSAVLRVIDMDPQLADAELVIGDQTIRFAHGVAEPRNVDWRAQNSNLSIRLQLRAIDGRTEAMRFDGPWALFRFFDAGRDSSERGTAERRETLHRGTLGTLRMEWRAVTIPSPIWSDLLSSFRCPH